MPHVWRLLIFIPDDLRETVSHLTVGGGGIQISELGGLRAQV